MELIYTNKNGVDIGILDMTEADFAFGVSENDFSITTNTKTLPEIGALIYAENSDLGGIVTGYESISGDYKVDVIGLTWTGVIGTKVLAPNAGSAYYSVSGDVRNCLNTLIGRLDLGGLFYVDPTPLGRSTTHTFKGNRTDKTQKDTDRYMDGWAAVWQLLQDAGAKIRMVWDADARKVKITVMDTAEFIDAEHENVATTTIKVKQQRTTNHLICLGKGELAQRTRVDVYLSKNGTATQTQYYRGIDEIADVYENTQDELADLIQDGKAKLLELQKSALTVEVSTDGQIRFDVGDVVGGTDTTTRVSAKGVITKKIAKYKDGIVSYSYDTTTY